MWSWLPTFSSPPNGTVRKSGRRRYSHRWLTIITRPSGTGWAATSRPWYRRVAAPDTVPEAYPPSPLVTSHSRSNSASSGGRSPGSHGRVSTSSCACGVASFVMGHSVSRVRSRRFRSCMRAAPRA